jgi:hypothetical protein
MEAGELECPVSNEKMPAPPLEECPALFSLFKTLDEFPEEDAKWIVPGWIPVGQISVIAADGGIGKLLCGATLLPP